MVKKTFKITFIQFKKLQITDYVNVKKKSWNFYIPFIYGFVVIYFQNLELNTVLELVWSQKIDFYHPFCLQTRSLWLINVKSVKYKNAKFSGFVIYVKTIIYLLLLNFYDYTFHKIVKLFVSTSSRADSRTYSSSRDIWIIVCEFTAPSLLKFPFHTFDKSSFASFRVFSN